MSLNCDDCSNNNSYYCWDCIPDEPYYSYFERKIETASEPASEPASELASARCCDCLFFRPDPLDGICYGVCPVEGYGQRVMGDDAPCEHFKHA